MKTLPRLLIGLCLVASGPLAAQTLFSDSLVVASDGNWSDSVRGSGTTTFGAGGLGYSLTASPTGDDRGYQSLTAYSAPSTSSWSAQVDVTLAAFSGLTDSQFVNLNLAIAKQSAPTTFSTTLAIDRYNRGSGIVMDFDTHVTTAGTTTQLTEVASSATSATLRISYDSAASQFTYSYDADGPLNGVSFVTAHTVSITGWSMQASDVFTLALVGASGATSGFGPSVTATDAYFQNFSVSAVPEPSTYALLAGATALGAAVLRRRSLRLRSRAR